MPCACTDGDSPPNPAAKEPGPVASSDYDVLLLSIDALRADHLDCYGYSRKTAPNLAELAERGILFEQAIVQWPKTAPSFASMMTSTYCSTSGVMTTLAEDRLPQSYDTLAEILHGAGYQTFGVVANLSLDARYQFQQGFDRYVCERVNHSGDVITGMAKEMISLRDRTRRYFLWVHYLDPHSPYRPPKEFLDRFVGDALYESDLRSPVKLDPAALDPSRKPVQPNSLGQIPKHVVLPGKELIRDYVAAYDADIAYCDASIGQLLDWMKQEGHLERVIIVVVADHGESLGDHDYFFEHGRFPYEDCTRVPLIVVHPELAPQRVKAPIALLDLAPTLLDLLNLGPGWQFEGASRVDWLTRGGPDGEPPPVFTESGYSQRFTVSLRRGRWKLIRYCDPQIASEQGGRPYQLFDLDTDPGELVDLVADESETFAALRDELDAYVEIAFRRVPPPAEGASVELDAAEKALVDQLGYADGDH